MNKYGEEISYDFDLLKVEDYNDLQPFSCGNDRLDYHIHHEIIKDGMIVDEDGLYFIFRDLETQKIIAVVSLATSGILYQIDNYTHILPAIKIDVLAVEKQYQKVHYNEESKMSPDPSAHYYFSDDIMGVIVSHCRKIAEEKALTSYIVLYADKRAYRYYIRNGFCDYQRFMVKERNQEINENIPMYMQL